MSTDAFREELRSFLDESCPPCFRHAPEGRKRPESTPADHDEWLRITASRGYTTPTWPSEYGGGGLSKAEVQVLNEEVARIGSFIPGVSFFGTTMLGPVMLEFATEEQKHEHLPKITSGEITWCQGYSEPGAGSDLASLQTRAVRDGDHFIINGSKVWTTHAHLADWMFCLVRTDPEAPKHDGISFILFSLHDPGVTVSPIELISGQSDFCQVFFENVRAETKNLVGPLNGGWTIAKRLLQHERQMLSSGVLGSVGTTETPWPEEEKRREAEEGRHRPQPRSALAETAQSRTSGDGENGTDRRPAPARSAVAQYEIDCALLRARR